MPTSGQHHVVAWIKRLRHVHGRGSEALLVDGGGIDGGTGTGVTPKPAWNQYVRLTGGG